VEARLISDLIAARNHGKYAKFQVARANKSRRMHAAKGASAARDRSSSKHHMWPQASTSHRYISMSPLKQLIHFQSAPPVTRDAPNPKVDLY
jgi:hypothetical protein